MAAVSISLAVPAIVNVWDPNATVLPAVEPEIVNVVASPDKPLPSPVNEPENEPVAVIPVTEAARVKLSEPSTARLVPAKSVNKLP